MLKIFRSIKLGRLISHLDEAHLCNIASNALMSISARLVKPVLPLEGWTYFEKES